ncbi:MAG: hypothetical protein K2X47_14090 [Bdellovibrionales bacterium]|nr:hypothetical protein [Bdellovibrionales bacterium]
MAWAQIVFNPIRRVWNKVALAVTLGTILTTMAPLDLEANGLAHSRTRSTLAQTARQNDRDAIGVNDASNAFQVAANKMQHETRKSLDALDDLIIEDIKLLDQRLSELSPSEHSLRELIAEEKSKLVSLLGETSSVGPR